MNQTVNGCCADVLPIDFRQGSESTNNNKIIFRYIPTDFTVVVACSSTALVTGWGNEDV